jgi:hypothetical protein
MFLPARPGFLEVDSLLRLDELQSVFTSNLEPTRLALGDEVTSVLRGQLQDIFAGTGPALHRIEGAIDQRLELGIAGATES